MRDSAAIQSGHISRSVQPNGVTAFFFGGTTVLARERHINGGISLEPVGGDQVACGEWVDLSLDETAQYCRMLEQHFFAQV